MGAYHGEMVPKADLNKIQEEYVKSEQRILDLELQVDAITKAAKRLLENDGAGATYDAAEASKAREELRQLVHSPNDTRQMTAGEMAKGPHGPVPKSVKDACDRAISDLHPQGVEPNVKSKQVRLCDVDYYICPFCLAEHPSLEWISNGEYCPQCNKKFDPTIDAGKHPSDS